VADKTMNARDAKLVQWLGEAYAKEAELEADLTAHIATTEKMSYKKRLRKHLTETRDHKRRVAARIKKLG
jgi:ferritin-like metal-binding protein YciE